jgi:uncharacterized protein YdhG (YjbR/CyaY superfamily)
MPAQKRENKANKDQDVLGYVHKQAPRHAAICKTLLKEIATVLPQANPRIYHASPAWFIGENAVVGFSVSEKKGVTLLFWNGQAPKEPDLKAVGKFKAAQIQFQDQAEIDSADLRRWLKRACHDIWDFAELRKRTPVASSTLTAG